MTLSFLTRSSFALVTLALFAGCSAPASRDADGTSTATAAEVRQADAVLQFSTSAWTPTLEGALEAGSTLRIAYDPARLPQCRRNSRNESWDMRMHYRFDDGPIAYIVVADPGMSLRVEDTLAIPEGASRLTVWFENFSAINGGSEIVCQAWDSDYGRNYNFDIR